MKHFAGQYAILLFNQLNKSAVVIFLKIFSSTRNNKSPNYKPQTLKLGQKAMQQNNNNSSQN